MLDKDRLLEFDISDRGGSYLLAACRPQSPPFICLWRDDPASTPMFVPAASETEFRITSRTQARKLFCLRDEVAVHAFRRWSPLDMAKSFRLSRFHPFTRFEDGDLTILPLLHRSGQEGIDLARAMRTLAEWGVGVSMPDLQATLSYDLVDHPARAPVPMPAQFPAIGIVIHLHYPDVWPDFEKRLRQITLPFKLIVTVSAEDTALSAGIRSFHPESRILVYPNRGRDVGPFIQLLREGHFDDVDLVCKLHGKKSMTLGPRRVFGDVWRRLLLNSLIGSDDAVRRIVRRFCEQPRLGMIGPSRFRLPNEFRHSHRDVWSNNEELTYRLVQRLGGSRESFKLDFFAGTMFWIRRELLDILKPLDLSQSDFPDEAGQPDGTLQHALERVFGALPSLANPAMILEDAIWPPEA